MAQIRAPSRTPSAPLRWLQGVLAPKSSGEATVETLLERVLDIILRDGPQGACHLLESRPPHDRDRAATLKAPAGDCAGPGRAADASVATGSVADETGLARGFHQTRRALLSPC